MNQQTPIPEQPQVGRVHPIVYKEIAWEYKVLVRDLGEQEPLSEDKLNALRTRFYLKRPAG